MDTQQSNDDQLWRKARARVGFKRSLMAYLLVNTMLIGIWYYTTYQIGSYYYFWPFWPMFGWGIGLIFQYINAYHSNDIFSVDKEFEKLKNQNKN